MLSDIEIAHAAEVRPAREIAEGMGVLPDEVEPNGRYKAKVSLRILKRLAEAPNGRYVLVTAITPTPLGEGKTLTTVGLGQAFRVGGHSAISCIRQPSLGPVFGIKGGAAGGGYSQIVPMEDINLHLTGDVHAITAAHNLCAAFIDNHIYHGNALGIDPHAISWPRVLDISDRALRNVVIGLGGRTDGNPRESHFEITVASELMAILALSEDIGDLRARIGRIIVGRTFEGAPVTTDDLKVAGSMTVLMKETIKPNLMQNLDGGAAFVHAGPFANIAHGNSSIVADRIALKLADYVVTEAGFGADMGAEKFVNIKCRVSGLAPDAAVLVCTVRALKAHSGRFEVKPGRALDPALLAEDLDALDAGMPNLVKQIENVRSFGIPVVVAINTFPSDTPAEHALIGVRAREAGAFDVVTHHMHAEGGRGGLALAEAVAKACEEPAKLTFTYRVEAPVREKIAAIATRIYGASGVDFSFEAGRAMQEIADEGMGALPVCMAKTHLSLSHDSKLKGAPSGWRLPVRDVHVAAGAGFVYALCGDITTMPGLPGTPAGEHIDIDADGNVVGLS
ncbi:MAG: formate--tetrahydrofolate ligase [Actinobacteria bacterium]|nr:formate--tetrahydrofolate ligase [Actinomycetota bacterium]